jgi:hypothetical protein
MDQQKLNRRTFCAGLQIVAQDGCETGALRGNALPKKTDAAGDVDRFNPHPVSPPT